MLNNEKDLVATMVSQSLPAEAEADVIVMPEPPGKVGWRPSAIALDIATLGTGTVLAGLFNLALVFVVPKLISVEDYGYWRMFGLYSGYVGFMHFGFADGALLRWAGRPLEEFHHEIAPAGRFQFWLHVIVLAPLCAIAALFLEGPLRFVAIAVAVYALIFNLVTLLQFGLQSARIFRPVAISTVASSAFFLAFVLLWRSKWQSDYREVTTFYIAGWLVVLFFLLVWMRQWGDARIGTTVKGLGRDCISNGWAIVLANTGVMLIMYADRLAVSWAAKIQDFAQYSLAASALAVPIMVIQVCSNVFFSHLAGITPEGRRHIYGISSRMLLIVWAVLLPYYFALNVFIRHFLPKYAPSLQYARVLLLGIPFVAAIQVLQMSYVYLNGMQKRFLVQTAVVLAISLGMTSFAALHTGSLRSVAGVQVAVLAAWWLFNEWTLRKLTGEYAGAWVGFLALYTLVSVSYWLTSNGGLSTATSVWIYSVIVAIILGLGYRDRMRLLLPETKGLRSSVKEE
jgi:O-antigen/teichoic acid export membrane protein